MGDDAAKLTPPKLELSEEELRFIRDEGLDILAAFRGIRDRDKRNLVLELARAIAESEPPADGVGNGFSDKIA